jgi:hypothetical protein
LFKASWKKENVKMWDPKEILKTLMPPIGVQKLEGSENPKCNLEGDQTTHL